MACRWKYQVIQTLDDKIGPDLRKIVEGYLGPNAADLRDSLGMTLKFYMAYRKALNHSSTQSLKALREERKADLIKCRRVRPGKIQADTWLSPCPSLASAHDRIRQLTGRWDVDPWALEFQEVSRHD